MKYHLAPFARRAVLLLSFTAFPAQACTAENAPASAAVTAPSAAPEVVTGTRICVDWQRLISRHNLELPRLPESHTHSLRLGNGDIGVAVYAVPECLVLFVGKNDLLRKRTGTQLFWRPLYALALGEKSCVPLLLPTLATV